MCGTVDHRRSQTKEHGYNTLHGTLLSLKLVSQQLTFELGFILPDELYMDDCSDYQRFRQMKQERLARDRLNIGDSSGRSREREKTSKEITQA